MKNSSSKSSGRDSSQQDRQSSGHPSQHEQAQSGRSSSRQQGDTHRSGQQNADLNSDQPSRRSQQGDQSSQQGRNLPEGNQQQERQQNPTQQQQGATAEKMKGKWQQQVGNAKVAWGKLTEDELLKTEGQADKLSGLVRERYALSQEAADAQVKKFFTDYRY